ncbi:MAG TPA: AraC family transcriptional regulator [Thermoanaerobaculia bacterium]|nr:AraC family transcriptional regulator [Thermoanaerobaculia bacterium]
MNPRTKLLDLPAALVEDVHRDEASDGFSPDFQIALPYRGLFLWQVGDDEIVGDPNQVLFVRGGEPYRLQTRGFAELIITPDREVLSELAIPQHPLFRRRAWRANPELQSFRTRFLHWARSADPDPLQAEEIVLGLIRSAMQSDVDRETPCAATTARLIRRTKEILQSQLSKRILLTDVARAVGASPAYLTDLFTRVEGLSLHQYLTQLRLAHALVELPHTNDLTTLALDLGFSSHSHFTYAFRRGFGCTPSQFRESTRASPAILPVRAAEQPAHLVVDIGS